MKKYFIYLLTGLLTACTADDVPVQLPEQPKPLEAPQLSRSITATDAAIAAFTKDGTRTHLWKLEKSGDEWNWAAGTQATLSGWNTLVCVVPYFSNLNTTTLYTPSRHSTLMWGKMGKDEQHTDGRFYFKHVSHRLAQVFVEVDRYYSDDKLRIYLSTQGYFHALEGDFSDLGGSYKDITPEKTDSGTYVYTFSIVPQTFKKGENLLRYRDNYTTYYDYYYYKAEEDLTVPVNHRLNIRLKWEEDWQWGGRHYVTISVTGISLSAEEVILDPGKTAQLTATVRPGNATDKTVTWESDAKGVATVSSTGLVTAVSVGTATITAKVANGQTATCKVIVRAEIGGGLDTNGGDMDGGTTGSGPTINW